MPAKPYLRQPTPRAPIRPLVSAGLAVSGGMLQADSQPPLAKGGGVVSGTNTGDVTLAGESYIAISGQIITAAKPTEAQLSTADNTTLDVSTSKHGFAPKAPNDATKYLDGTGSYSVPGGTLASGTYTPTLTNVANLDASTAYACQYLRVGSVVTVSGRVDIDPTLTATSTILGISLPVASTFAANTNCGGVAFAEGIAGMGGAIEADATNFRAQLVFISSDVTNKGMWFLFTYRVI